MIRLLLLLIVLPVAGWSQTCTLSASIQTEAPHGTLSEGTRLEAQITYTPTRRMRMGSEVTSYLTEGSVTISGPDATGLTGRVGVIHVVRAPHGADYISFDVVDVAGDLGRVTDYEDPMLLSFFADRGELKTFDLPTTPAAFGQFDRKQTFQVHTPDTMWTLPGIVESPLIDCS